MTDTPFRPTIRTQADLEEAWRHLMGPWGYGGASTWLMLVLDDEVIPHLTEIAECEDPPEPEGIDGLADILRMLDEEIAPGARVAFLRSRPGADVVTDTDRAWASGLYDAARRAGVPAEVVHLATRGSVRAIPPDDLELDAASA
jgi:hypothetical protein